MGQAVFLTLFISFVGLGLCDYGGHDLFTSLAQLEVLWQNELVVIEELQKLEFKEENITSAIKNYVTQHQLLTLDQLPTYDFLGHPINAYHFVRHVSHGWYKIREAIKHIDRNQTEGYDYLFDREKQNKLPSLFDTEGGAYGLVRLHNLYKLDTKRMIREGVIATTLDNGQVVVSEPSVLRLNSYDLVRMSLEASDNGLYGSAADLMDEAEKMAKLELQENRDLSHLVDYTPDPVEYAKKSETIKKTHDHFLNNKGMKGRTHRCHQHPYDKKLRKKKKFKKEFKLERMIIGRNLTEHMNKMEKVDSDLFAELTLASEIQMDDLCRGKQLRTDEEMSKLYCTYSSGSSDWLKLGPMKLEFNSLDPYHVVIRNILFDHECDNITSLLGRFLDFPPGRMNYRSKKNDWTMKNCWPDERHSKVLEKLNRRIEHLSGLEADSSKGNSEGYMCGNYGIGGFYFIHPDFHHPDMNHYRPGNLGNRVSTILTVMQSPEAGGATVWPNAGITVFPEKGSAAFWFNTRPSDMPDQYTKHAACPVLLGQKWIGNKWVGYNAQWSKRKCQLGPMDLFKGPGLKNKS